LGAAAGSILLYFLLVALRIGYPFELEIFEGMTADHVDRILQGLPIYAAPSLDFVPNIYPPLYYYLSAGLAWVFGVNLWVLRLVSVTASVGCLAVLFAYVRRETDSRFCGFLSAGFYAATYGVCSAWFDVARVDSLYLFFLLSGFYILRFHETRQGGVLAGVLLALAFFTKQTTLSAALPVLGAVTLVRPRQAGWILAPLAILVVGGSFVLDRLHPGGWYRAYVLEHLTQHALQPGRGHIFWTRHILLHMPLISLAALAALWKGFPNRTHWRERLFLPALAVGLLSTAWIGAWSLNGAENALMPDCALFALLMGILFHQANKRATSPKWQMAICLLVLAQFALVVYNPYEKKLVYDPRERVPSRADREAGEALVERLKQIDGDVWIAWHGHLGRMAGKPIHALYFDPLLDVVPWGVQPTPTIREQIDQAIREQRFAAILLDEHRLYLDWWGDYYEDAGPVFPRRDVFWPVTGGKTRPKTLFVPREKP
jgi:4-amino-4-deoxy-L-arabinose transferase-like glycosyltransferase